MIKTILLGIAATAFGMLTLICIAALGLAIGDLPGEHYEGTGLNWMIIALSTLAGAITSIGFWLSVRSMDFGHRSERRSEP